jgi:hypothetical protein
MQNAFQSYCSSVASDTDETQRELSSVINNCQELFFEENTQFVSVSGLAVIRGLSADLLADLIKLLCVYACSRVAGSTCSSEYTFRDECVSNLAISVFSMYTNTLTLTASAEGSSSEESLGGNNMLNILIGLSTQGLEQTMLIVLKTLKQLFEQLRYDNAVFNGANQRDMGSLFLKFSVDYLSFTLSVIQYHQNKKKWFLNFCEDILICTLSLISYCNDSILSLGVGGSLEGNAQRLRQLKQTLSKLVTMSMFEDRNVEEFASMQLDSLDNAALEMVPVDNKKGKQKYNNASAGGEKKVVKSYHDTMFQTLKSVFDIIKRSKGNAEEGDIFQKSLSFANNLHSLVEIFSKKSAILGQIATSAAAVGNNFGSGDTGTISGAKRTFSSASKANSSQGVAALDALNTRKHLIRVLHFTCLLLDTFAAAPITESDLSSALPTASQSSNKVGEGENANKQKKKRSKSGSFEQEEQDVARGPQDVAVTAAAAGTGVDVAAVMARLVRNKVLSACLVVLQQQAIPNHDSVRKYVAHLTRLSGTCVDSCLALQRHCILPTTTAAAAAAAAAGNSSVSVPSSVHKEADRILVLRIVTLDISCIHTIAAIDHNTVVDDKLPCILQVLAGPSFPPLSASVLEVKAEREHGYAKYVLFKSLLQLHGELRLLDQLVRDMSAQERNSLAVTATATTVAVGGVGSTSSSSSIVQSNALFHIAARPDILSSLVALLTSAPIGQVPVIWAHIGHHHPPPPLAATLQAGPITCCIATALMQAQLQTVRSNMNLFHGTSAGTGDAEGDGDGEDGLDIDPTIAHSTTLLFKLVNSLDSVSRASTNDSEQLQRQILLTLSVQLRFAVHSNAGSTSRLLVISSKDKQHSFYSLAVGPLLACLSHLGDSASLAVFVAALKTSLSLLLLQSNVAAKEAPGRVAPFASAHAALHALLSKLLTRDLAAHPAGEQLEVLALLLSDTRVWAESTTAAAAGAAGAAGASTVTFSPLHLATLLKNSYFTVALQVFPASSPASLSAAHSYVLQPHPHPQPQEVEVELFERVGELLGHFAVLDSPFVREALVVVLQPTQQQQQQLLCSGNSSNSSSVGTTPAARSASSNAAKSTSKKSAVKGASTASTAVTTTTTAAAAVPESAFAQELSCLYKLSTLCGRCNKSLYHRVANFIIVVFQIMPTDVLHAAPAAFWHAVFGFVTYSLSLAQQDNPEAHVGSHINTPSKRRLSRGGASTTPRRSSSGGGGRDSDDEALLLPSEATFATHWPAVQTAVAGVADYLRAMQTGNRAREFSAGAGAAAAAGVGGVSAAVHRYNFILPAMLAMLLPAPTAGSAAGPESAEEKGISSEHIAQFAAFVRMSFERLNECSWDMQQQQQQQQQVVVVSPRQARSSQQRVRAMEEVVRLLCLQLDCLLRVLTGSAEAAGSTGGTGGTGDKESEQRVAESRRGLEALLMTVREMVMDFVDSNLTVAPYDDDGSGDDSYDNAYRTEAALGQEQQIVSTEQQPVEALAAAKVATYDILGESARLVLHTVTSSLRSALGDDSSSSNSTSFTVQSTGNIISGSKAMTATVTVAFVNKLILQLAESCFWPEDPEDAAHEMKKRLGGVFYLLAELVAVRADLQRWAQSYASVATGGGSTGGGSTGGGSGSSQIESLSEVVSSKSDLALPEVDSVVRTLYGYAREFLLSEGGITGDGGGGAEVVQEAVGGWMYLHTVLASHVLLQLDVVSFLNPSFLMTSSLASFAFSMSGGGGGGRGGGEAATASTICSDTTIVNEQNLECVLATMRAMIGRVLFSCADDSSLQRHLSMGLVSLVTSLVQFCTVSTRGCSSDAAGIVHAVKHCLLLPLLHEELEGAGRSRSSNVSSFPSSGVATSAPSLLVPRLCRDLLVYLIEHGKKLTARQIYASPAAASASVFPSAGAGFGAGSDGEGASAAGAGTSAAAKKQFQQALDEVMVATIEVYHTAAANLRVVATAAATTSAESSLSAVAEITALLSHCSHVTESIGAVLQRQSKAAASSKSGSGRGRRLKAPSRKTSSSVASSSAAADNKANATTLRCDVWFDGVLSLAGYAMSHIHGCQMPVSISSQLQMQTQVQAQAQVQVQVQLQELRVAALQQNTAAVLAARGVLSNLERMVLMSTSSSLPNLNTAIGLSLHMVSSLCAALLEIEHQCLLLTAATATNTATTGVTATTRASPVQLLASLEQQIAACYHVLCRLFVNIASAKDIEKHVHFVASALVEVLSKTQLTRQFQEIACPGIYALFEKCQVRQKTQMFGMLDPQSRTLMTTLHNEFMRSFKFVGK